MNNKAIFLLLISLVLLPLYASADRVGGWAPITNLTDPYVVKVGEFAVSEHNKQSKSELKFESVVKGESQVVSGTNYRLVVAANDKGMSNNYEAIVWDQPWLKSMNLTSFKSLYKGRFL